MRNVLKLDVLGHDDPTMIRKLQDLSGIDPNEIPMDDEGVMALFSGTDVLGVTPEQNRDAYGDVGDSRVWNQLCPRHGR